MSNDPNAETTDADVTATHVLTDVPSPPDVPADETDGAADVVDDAPTAGDGTGTVWICPGCGARYTENVTCTIEHEPLQTEPATVTADELPDAAAPPADEPIDTAPTVDPDKVAAVAAAVDNARTAFDELAQAVAALSAA